jgi:hypothetical protein
VKIQEARQIIRKFVSSRWDTEKLCAVLAFCEDGKMGYIHSYCCLLGVDSAKVIHEASMCPDLASHWDCYYVLHAGPESVAESAYWMLGVHGSRPEYFQQNRDREFSAILRSVIAEREIQESVKERSVEMSVLA